MRRKEPKAQRVSRNGRGLAAVVVYVSYLPGGLVDFGFGWVRGRWDACDSWNAEHGWWCGGGCGWWDHQG
jgi:hypothetical protein